MAKYRITAPDGKQYDVEGNGTQEEALAHFQQQYSAQQPQPSSTMQDIGSGLAKSAANLYRGVASVPNMLLDLPANIHNAVSSSPPWRTQSQMQNEALSSLGVQPDKPGYEQLVGAVTRGLGAAAVPMGVGGALAKSASPVASGVGEAMASQPGTQLASAATGAGSSDVARQMGAGPIGQAVAGIAGGAVPVAASALAQRMAPNSNIQTPEQFKEISRSKFAQAEQLGAPVPAEKIAGLADDLQDVAHQAGMREYNDGRGLVGTVGTIQKIADQGDVPFGELAVLRKEIRTNAASPNAEVRRAAVQMSNKLDDFVGGLQGGPEISAARDYWRRGSNAEMVSDMVQRAKDGAGPGGLDVAIKGEFRRFVKNPNKMRMLTDEEQDAMRQVARGGMVNKALSSLGRFFAIRGPVSAATDFFIGGGPMGAMGLEALGEAGKKGASMATQQNLQAAQEQMLQGANPIARQATQLPPAYTSLLATALSQNQPGSGVMTPSELKKLSEKLRNSQAASGQ